MGTYLRAYANGISQTDIPKPNTEVLKLLFKIKFN